MHDVVGEVLAQRKALDRGAGAGVALSLLLHAGITAAAVYAALRHGPEQSVPVIEIKFAQMPSVAAGAPARPRAAEAAAPTPAPKPQPVVEATVKPVAKPAPPKTVPFSTFGKSTKKGADPAPQPQPATGNAQRATAAEIPVGGTGAVVEGDFPYTIYIDRMTTLIGHHWTRPEVPPGTTTIVKFVLDRDGTVHDAVLEAESGNGTFDRAALRGVIEASPLPPLPFAYNGTYVTIHLTFK